MIEVQADTVPQAAGMAIKLLQVKGEKLLESEKNAETQDFVMIDFPTFFVRNLKDYELLHQDMMKGQLENFFKTRPEELKAIMSMRSQPFFNPVQSRYWSQTSYLLGVNAIKFSATSVSRTTNSPPEAMSPDFLQETMKKSVSSEDVYYRNMARENLVLQNGDAPCVLTSTFLSLCYHSNKCLVRLIMLKAYRYRIYPIFLQGDLLIRSMGCCRWFYNYALNLTSQTYKETGKGLSRNEIIKLLPNLKKEYEWLAEAPSQSLQQVALDLSSAFLNFFEKRAKYPNFKRKHDKQSIRFPQSIKLNGEYLTLPKLGKVYCKVSRLPGGELRSVTVTMTPSGQFFASCLYDDGAKKPEPIKEGKAVGIDVGLTHFAITSDGSKHGNPKYYRKYEEKLVKRQKQLDGKQKGSNNRNQARRNVAKVHEKITRCREDFLHKLSRKLVDDNQILVVENLAVRNMVKNPKLSKSISDSGWGMFCTILKYKAGWEGKIYIEVDRFFPSSKTCNVCLDRVGSLPLDVKTWDCSNCGTKNIDRDINAAKNIRDEGLRILAGGHLATASGERVRPSKGTAFNRHFSVKEESPP